MKRKGSIFIKKNVFVFLVLISVFAYSCQDDKVLDGDNANPELPIEEDDPVIVEGEVLKEITTADLLSMKSHLETGGINTTSDLSEEEASSRGTLSNVLLRAIKVTTKSPHPADPSKQINLSGVMLVPKYSRTPLRIVLAPVPTFTANSQAPSNLFKKGISLVNEEGLLNYLYFWSLEAYRGFAVLLPDYPGYGDSYQQCFTPYVVQKPMVKAAIDLTKASQEVLKKNDYQYKSDIIVTGYSQGGFVATATTRELEQNASHGLKVSLLVSGGTPTNLNHIIENVLRRESFSPSHLIPYAACGFKSNGYADIVLSDAFKEPYASNLYKYFDGTNTDLGSLLPSVNAELFTNDMLYHWAESPKFTVLRKAANENSIQPWANRCRMFMIHGYQDITIPYQSGKDFAARQNQAGGNVVFQPVFGDHLTGVVNYYIWASNLLLLYR